MPEATSNSTVTIPGGISTNDILDSLSASELLSALTGGADRVDLPALLPLPSLSYMQGFPTFGANFQ